MMPRMQRATRAPSRYIPPHDLRRAAKQKPRRRVGAVGAQAVFDWRLNKVLGLDVEPVSPEKPRLQQRMHFHVSTSYKRASVQSWAHASVVDREERFTFEDLKGDDELGELVLGALWEFVRDSYVASPSQEDMHVRLGQHAPERLPPLSVEQAQEQALAFERTLMQQAALDMAAADGQ